jgi:hypothetical protein
VSDFKDAERWRYARQFLAIEDIERWSEEMRGHQPSEEESRKADQAIDVLLIERDAKAALCAESSGDSAHG